MYNEETDPWSLGKWLSLRIRVSADYSENWAENAIVHLHRVLRAAQPAAVTFKPLWAKKCLLNDKCTLCVCAYVCDILFSVRDAIICYCLK